MKNHQSRNVMTRESLHDYYRRKLRGYIGQAFINDLARSVRDDIPDDTRIKFWLYPEFAVYDGNITFSEVSGKRNYLDGLILLEWPKKQNGLASCAIEIKDALHDLISDSKMKKELWHSDFAFLAVPDELVEAATCKIHETDDLLANMGILNLTNGEIVVLPKQMDIPEEGHAFLTSKFVRMLLSGVKKIEDIEMYHEALELPRKKLEYVQIDKLTVNAEYAPRIIRIQQSNRGWKLSQFL